MGGLSWVCWKAGKKRISDELKNRFLNLCNLQTNWNIRYTNHLVMVNFNKIEKTIFYQSEFANFCGKNVDTVTSNRNLDKTTWYLRFLFSRILYVHMLVPWRRRDKLNREILSRKTWPHDPCGQTTSTVLTGTVIVMKDNGSLLGFKVTNSSLWKVKNNLPL